MLKSLANNITLFNETKLKEAPDNSGASFLLRALYRDGIIALSEGNLRVGKFNICRVLE